MCRARRQLHIIDDLAAADVIDEELHRFDDAAAGFIDRAALRVATAHRRDPPAGLVSFVSDACTAWLTGAALTKPVVETHDDALTEMIRGIGTRLFATEVMVGLGKLDLAGLISQPRGA